ncbi:hypothetical protein ACGRHY_09660 [Streptomyces sp. HK10]|uniref:hypothetical protein n=1 Tax=Streptomyces sp. HK10 TaxID=3373255 RepID=UPI003749E59C
MEVNDPMRDGEEGARVTEAALRRLIAEGSRPGSGPQGSGDLPSDDSLRALAAVLGAAVPPPGSGVLKGEEEALAVFRAARDERAAAAAPTAAAGLRGRLARLTRRLGRTRTGALGVVVAAVLGSGVAVASGGVPFLPGSGPSGTPDASRVTGTAPTPPVPASPKATTTGEAGPARPHHDGTGPGTVPPSKASARIVALCRAQQRGPGSPDGAVRKPLIAAAGGRDRVAAYCAAVLEGQAARPSPVGGGRGDENGGGSGTTPDTPDRPDQASGSTGSTGNGQENANPGNPGSGIGNRNGGDSGNPGGGNAGGRGSADRTGGRPGNGNVGGGRGAGTPGAPGGGAGDGGNGAGGTRAEAAQNKGAPADRPVSAPR